MNPYHTLARSRLEELKKERESGLAQLSHLEQRVEELKHTLLRIGGAIQVLEELEHQSQPQTSPIPVTI